MIALAQFDALLPQELLAHLAAATHCDAPNQVRLPGRVVFLCLLNTVLNSPVVTQRLLDEHFAQRMGGTADHSSFGKRLGTLPPAYLHALFVHLYRQLEPLLASAPGSGPRLRFVDATTVTGSAKLLTFGIRQRSGGRNGTGPVYRHVKAVMELRKGSLTDPGLPQLLHLCREQRETNDNQALGPTMAEVAQPGQLFVFDRGCKDRDRLLQLHQAGAFWLTPRCGQGVREDTEVWKDPRDAAAWERAKQEAQAAAEAHPREPAPCLLRRVVLGVFEAAEERASSRLRRKWAPMPVGLLEAERYCRRTHRWEAWTLLTNLPLSADRTRLGPFTFAELLEVYRHRWDIETFFKLLKQHLSYAHLTSYGENGIEVMILMALIGALLLRWYQRESGLDRGWRSVKFWLAEEVREWTRSALAQTRARPQSRQAVAWRRAAA
jgi:hypothetical protein